jgi:hypothetical protein
MFEFEQLAEKIDIGLAIFKQINPIDLKFGN